MGVLTLSLNSYFPTEELENVPTAPALAAVMAEGGSQQQQQLAIGEETGLPFIGYTYKRLYTIYPPIYLSSSMILTCVQ